MHCLGALGHWTMQFLQYTGSVPPGSGHLNSCNALPHNLGGMGCATHATHCDIACGPWAVEHLQCEGPLAGGTASPPHEAVAVKSADLLQRTASLPGRT